MEDFTAKDAKALSEASKSKENLTAILMDIKRDAENGKTSLDTRKPLSTWEKGELIKRGFTVIAYDSWVIQVDGVYDRISW